MTATPKNIITRESILAKIVKETYIMIPGTTKTICSLDLQNGYNVTGESACVDPDNFNEEIGNHWAKEDAIKKIWVLEGYLLKEKLFQESVLNRING
jgi:hypothetical protein